MHAQVLTQTVVSEKIARTVNKVSKNIQQPCMGFFSGQVFLVAWAFLVAGLFQWQGFFSGRAFLVASALFSGTYQWLWHFLVALISGLGTFQWQLLVTKRSYPSLRKSTNFSLCLALAIHATNFYCNNCRSFFKSKKVLNQHPCKSRRAESSSSSIASGCKKKREQKSEARGADGPSGSNASRSNSVVHWDKPVHCLDPKNC